MPDFTVIRQNSQPLDFSDERLEPGDTTAFLEKMLRYMNELEAWSIGVNETASDLNALSTELSSSQVLQARLQGRLTYATKAGMVTAGAPPSAGTDTQELAEVWNDSLQTNNGIYGWDGSAWIKPPSDIYNFIASTLTESDSSFLEAFEYTYNAIERITSSLVDYSGDDIIVPVIVDANNVMALGVNRNTGQLVAPAGILGLPNNEDSLQRDSFDADYNHFLFYGQSLSVGSKGIPVLSTSQSYGSVMFSGGTRSDTGEYGSFLPLVESEDLSAPDGGSSRGETPCSGAADRISQMILSENPSIDHTLLLSTAGHGGYRISQLNSSSVWYQKLIDHVTGGFDTSTISEEGSYALQAVGWLQGENDVISEEQTRESYTTQLVNLIADINVDTKSITGQSWDTVLISYQLSWSIAQNNKIALAQLDAEHSSQLIAISTPTFFLPHAPDQVHLNSIGYRLVGAYFGRAYKKLVVDGNWSPLKAINYYRSGRIIEIKHQVPVLPIQLDDSTVGQFINEGYKIMDDNGEVAITSVTVKNADTIKIVCTSTPVGTCTVRYGLDYNTVGMSSANSAGGNLVDSSPDTITIESIVYDMFNHCLAYEVQV